MARLHPKGNCSNAPQARVDPGIMLVQLLETLPLHVVNGQFEPSRQLVGLSAANGPDIGLERNDGLSSLQDRVEDTVVQGH